jgi:lipopolysaccharide export system permease protein
MWKSRRVILYFLSEMLPSFFLGLIIFISILLMFQALRLTEFVLVHGIQASTIFSLIGFMSISFLPILLPMSLLFAVLMTYNRFSQNSEIIALKSTGTGNTVLILPAFILAVLVYCTSAQTAFFMAPWGNRQFEVLITQLSNTKAAASIKEGTFTEGFFNLVIYANKVDNTSGLIQDLFIFNEQDNETPITIIAKTGEIIPDQTNPGHNILLRLSNGEIHRNNKNHTVINFDSYDINLNDPIEFQEKNKSAQSLSIYELNEKISSEKTEKSELTSLQAEYHKRFSLSFACFIFALIGVSFGIQNDRRSAKASGFVLSVGFIILYWIMYLTFEGMIRNQQITASVGAWMTNLIFFIFGFLNLRKKLI